MPGSIKRFLDRLGEIAEAADYSPVEELFQRVRRLEREIAALKSRDRDEGLGTGARPSHERRP